MKVILVQQDIVWGNHEANRMKLDAVLESAAARRPDLVVFPEMFSTGFATKPDGIAEESPSASFGWMKVRAAEMNCALAGSIALKEGGLYRNRFCFVKPDGEVTTYDKRHLFTYGGEHKTFTAGHERCIVEWRGIRFLLMVCYDLRFPIWSRNLDDYDAAIYVANWPTPRQLAWNTLSHARAIENQCYVLAINRCGKDPVCEYTGGTALINPYGEDIVKAADFKEEYVEGEIDMKMLNGYREKFPVLEDADRFILEK